VKAKLIAILKEIVQAHQIKRNAITDEEVKEWMSVRKLSH
jgi:hypothetical protein